LKNFLPGNDATCALGTSRIKSVYSRLITQELDAQFEQQL